MDVTSLVSEFDNLDVVGRLSSTSVERDRTWRSKALLDLYRSLNPKVPVTNPVLGGTIFKVHID